MTEHWPHHSTHQHILYILKLKEQLLNDPLIPAVNALGVSHTVPKLTYEENDPQTPALDDLGVSHTVTQTHMMKRMASRLQQSMALE